MKQILTIVFLISFQLSFSQIIVTEYLLEIDSNKPALSKAPEGSLNGLYKNSSNFSYYFTSSDYEQYANFEKLTFSKPITDNGILFEHVTGFIQYPYDYTMSNGNSNIVVYSSFMPYSITEKQSQDCLTNNIKSSTYPNISYTLDYHWGAYYRLSSNAAIEYYFNAPNICIYPIVIAYTKISPFVRDSLISPNIFKPYYCSKWLPLLQTDTSYAKFTGPASSCDIYSTVPQIYATDYQPTLLKHVDKYWPFRKKIGNNNYLYGWLTIEKINETAQRTNNTNITNYKITVALETLANTPIKAGQRVSTITSIANELHYDNLVIKPNLIEQIPDYYTKYEILNTTGQIIQSDNLKNNQLLFTDLSDGIVIIRLYSNNSVKTIKTTINN